MRDMRGRLRGVCVLCCGGVCVGGKERKGG